MQNEDGVFSHSASALAHLVRQEKISSTELVEAAFKKIEADNPQLNAVISTRYEAAIQESEQINNPKAPFAGIPILLKGLGQSMRDEPDTFGNRYFQNLRAQENNNYVNALQKAGFIIIGQTNFPEFGFKNITDSKLYGVTRNPWNLDYQPGGSSGGAGAALADGMVPIAAGNDGGGSIRIPASWTGTIGLKPTRGRVPTGPDDWRSWQGASVNFALTRSVEDTVSLLGELQTVQRAAVFQTPWDPSKFVHSLQDPIEQRNLTIGWTTESPVGTPVDPEAIAAVHEAVQFLEDNHIRTEEIKLPTDGVRLMEAYYTMNEGETAALFDTLRETTGHELTQDEMEPLTWALYQTGRHISASQYSRSLDVWDHAGYQMTGAHKDYPLILTPTTAFTAPRVDQPLVSEDNLERMKNITEFNPAEQQQLIWDQWLPALTLSPFTQQANLTGEPAISLPTHVTKDGLPLGIQFVAPKGAEELLLQVAYLFEQRHQFKMLHDLTD